MPHPLPRPGCRQALTELVTRSHSLSLSLSLSVSQLWPGWGLAAHVSAEATGGRLTQPGPDWPGQDTLVITTSKILQDTSIIVNTNTEFFESSFLQS